LPEHCAAEGYFSPSSLKAMAEHLGILREVARRHPDVRRSVLPHLHGIHRLATSALFYSFCLRNKRLFKLWGSLLADLAFFFDDLSSAHSGFVGSFPLEEMIEGESADFRRLDAADVCARNRILNDAVERAFRDAVTGNSLLTRSFSVEAFDTTFVYHLTHLTFYVSRWGAASEPFTQHFFHNLELATRWSRAVADADLIAECVVAMSYSGFEADRDGLIDLLLGREIAGGAVQREPSATEKLASESEYGRFRHTSLVALWAFSQYAYESDLELSLELLNASPVSSWPDPHGPDHEELHCLERLISNYAGVTPDDVSAPERASADQLARRIGGLRPFRCEEHHLKELEDGLPDIPSALSLPTTLTKTLLEIAADRSCHACLSNLRSALRAIASAKSLPSSGGEGDRLRELIEAFLRLPIVGQ
jgi:Domain of unknown function (DUF6895)